MHCIEAEPSFISWKVSILLETGIAPVSLPHSQATWLVNNNAQISYSSQYSKIPLPMNTLKYLFSWTIYCHLQIEESLVKLRTMICIIKNLQPISQCLNNNFYLIVIFDWGLRILCYKQSGIDISNTSIAANYYIHMYLVYNMINELLEDNPFSLTSSIQRKKNNIWPSIFT